ncbi:UPF0164 family protein [Salinispira pacifica]
MKKSASFLIISFIISCALAAPLSAADFADTYGYIVGIFDPQGPQNTGLTVFPTLMIPMGGLSEGMGTAYTAVGRDVGYLESNPAASSVMDYTELAIQHKNLIADANMESMVYTIRLDNLGLGAGLKFLHVPFTGYGSYGQQTTTFRYTETVATLNAAYNFLHGFYFNGLAFGANLKVAYRGEPNVPGLIENQSAFGIMGDAGLLARFNFLKFYPSRTRNFSIGVAAKNFGPPALGEPLPSLISAGIAYSPLRPLLFAFDLNVPVSLLPDVPPAPIGFAGGVDVTITDFFATQAGFLLKGGNPRVSLGADVKLANFALHVNYILDMTTQLGALDNFSVQVRFNFGDRGRAAREKKIEDQYLNALDALAHGDYDTTLKLCREIISVDPSFDPARETIKNVLRSIDLQQQMEQLKKPTSEPAPQTGGSSGAPDSTANSGQ